MRHTQACDLLDLLDEAPAASQLASLQRATIQRLFIIRNTSRRELAIDLRELRLVAA